MWRRRRNSRPAAIAASLVLFTIPLGTGPAAAADSDCLMGQVCVWNQYDFTGQKHIVPGQIGICQQMSFPVYSMKHNSTVLPRPVILASAVDACGQLLPTVVLPGSQLPHIDPPIRSLIGT
ncbi:peptidase inhibitor family I36 protein [Amycolatopsis sp. NPDC051071]|uniref:peptidase inhibitor family I36 protein n=1 Tax=Amycolatopsis sp. NPDC051071 TaxID=3154637 RepID=UPI00342C8227